MKKLISVLVLTCLLFGTAYAGEMYESKEFLILFPDGYHRQPDDDFITFSKDNGAYSYMFAVIQQSGFHPYTAITDHSYFTDFDNYMRGKKQPIEIGSFDYAKVVPILYSVYKLSDRYEIYTAFPGFNAYLIITAVYPLGCDYKTELEQWLCHDIFAHQ